MSEAHSAAVDGTATENAQPEETKTTEALDTESTSETQSGEAGDAAAPETELTPDQQRIKELERDVLRKQRAIDRRTAQRATLQEQLRQQQLTAPDASRTIGEGNDDDEPVQLSRKEIRELVNSEAQRIAPTLAGQQAEVARRDAVVQSLVQTWGQDRFEELSADLDDAFGGLVDEHQIAKPATEALFSAQNPAKLVEYLADPANSEEAARLATLSPVQAGMAIARLEAKLVATPAANTRAPVPSKRPAPPEPLRGQPSTNTGPDPVNTKAWIAWANEQERKRR